MRSDGPALAPTFRSRTQGNLLALVLLHPEQEWTVSDLARRLEAPLTTVQSEVSRLASADLLTTRRLGRSRLVRANLTSPAVAPLTQLTLVTFGPHVVIAEEFNQLKAAHVIVFGSWAARYHGDPGPSPADIDVLVVDDHVSRADIYQAAERSEARLGLPVNPVLRPESSWADPGADPLLSEIRARPFLEVTGAAT
jgi:predicted nucleotidyltransferase